MVSRGQLLALGFGRGAIADRLHRGSLHLLHRGVYAVGHRAVGHQGHLLAAALATGGVLSHRSAAALWGLTRTSPAVLDLTVPTRRRDLPGLRLHHACLPPDERTTRAGIPVTTPPRTLLDLAALLPPERLKRAVAQGEILRLTDALSVPDLLARHPGRRGATTLRAALHQAPQKTRSELEDRFLSLVARHGLPRPDTNATRSGYELDAVWAAHRLVVELDGRAAHSTRLAFEADRERDRRLAVAGWHVVRVTWRQLTRDTARVMDDLRALLESPHGVRARVGGP